MNPFKIVYRVSYSDTDQMGFMHHSSYLKYYETARWELFRNLGIPYNEIEKDGIILPVTQVFMDYIKPAVYDQKIQIMSSVKTISGARIIFDYQIMDEAGDLLNKAQITVACVKKITGKACIPPKKLSDVLKGFTNK